jgi:hypothetical protein
MGGRGRKKGQEDTIGKHVGRGVVRGERREHGESQRGGEVHGVFPDGAEECEQGVQVGTGLGEAGKGRFGGHGKGLHAYPGAPGREVATELAEVLPRHRGRTSGGVGQVARVPGLYYPGSHGMVGTVAFELTVHHLGVEVVLGMQGVAGRVEGERLTAEHFADFVLEGDPEALRQDAPQCGLACAVRAHENDYHGGDVHSASTKRFQNTAARAGPLRAA